MTSMHLSDASSWCGTQSSCTRGALARRNLHVPGRHSNGKGDPVSGTIIYIYIRIYNIYIYIYWHIHNHPEEIRLNMDCLKHSGLCKDFIEMSMFYVLQDDCVYIYIIIYIYNRERERVIGIVWLEYVIAKQDYRVVGSSGYQCNSNAMSPPITTNHLEVHILRSFEPLNKSK